MLQLLPEDKLSPEEHAKLFPQGKVDVNEQQIDLRKQNSWLLKLHEVRHKCDDRGMEIWVYRRVVAILEIWVEYPDIGATSFPLRQA